MTDQLMALKALEQAVVAGEQYRPKLVELFNAADMFSGHGILAMQGDTNAAIALAEAVVPEWRLMLQDEYPENEWIAEFRSLSYRPVSAANEIPSRALLLAIIHAKIVEVQG